MPITMDVFKGDAFSATSLSAAVEKIDYVPKLLGSDNFVGSKMSLFDPVPVRTEDIWIEERSYGAKVLATSPRGAPPHPTGGDIRKARGFKTVRLADASRVSAAELQSIRAFGSETELKQLTDEIARRQKKMMMNLDLTFEHMRLGCVQGIVKDKDGTTIYDWASEFNTSVPTASFSLTSATNGALRASVTAAKRSMAKALKGPDPTLYVGLCDDSFWDKLVKNAEIRAAFLATPFAQGLLQDTTWTNGATDWLDFGGVRFINYRGSDDNSTVAVPADSCAMFPVGAGIFQWVMAPGESFAEVNTLGQQFYSMLVPDDDRNRYVDVELYAYPLPVCTRPGALFTATS